VALFNPSLLEDIDMKNKNKSARLLLLVQKLTEDGFFYEEKLPIVDRVLTVQAVLIVDFFFLFFNILQQVVEVNHLHLLLALQNPPQLRRAFLGFSDRILQELLLWRSLVPGP